MPSLHELLKITLEELQTMDDEAIRRAFEKRKISQEEELRRQEHELEIAFKELGTQEKRREYLKQFPKKEASTTISPDIHGKQTILNTTAKINYDQIIKEYSTFVETQYKNHPEKENFKAEKYHFNNLEELQKSDFYKNLPKKIQQEYSAPGYPFPTTPILFKCDNLRDFLKFVQDIEGKQLIPEGTVKRFKDTLNAEKNTSSMSEEEKFVPKRRF